MKKMQVSFVALLILGFLISYSGIASAKTWAGREERNLGLAVHASFPYAEFGDEHKTGWGVSGIFDYPLIPLIDLTADVGYTHYSKANDGGGVDVWNLVFGARFALGVFFMGGETGYFTYVEEWSYVPSMGLRFGAFEGGIRYKSVHGASWTTLRFGYYF